MHLGAFAGHLVEARVAHLLLGIERAKPLGQCDDDVVRHPGDGAEIVQTKELVELNRIVLELHVDDPVESDHRLPDAAGDGVDMDGDALAVLQIELKRRSCEGGDLAARAAPRYCYPVRDAAARLEAIEADGTCLVRLAVRSFAR